VVAGQSTVESPEREPVVGAEQVLHVVRRQVAVEAADGSPARLVQGSNKAD
jgi:hypothetical protein